MTKSDQNPAAVVQIDSTAAARALTAPEFQNLAEMPAELK